MIEKKTEEILNSIRSEILNGSFQRGELVLEQRIAEKYSISKLTAREILQKLCHEKYLISFPRKGYLIYEITPEECKKIQQVRYYIESLSIKLIIKNTSDNDILRLKDVLDEATDSSTPYSSVNSKFHLYMAKLSENQYIYDTLFSFIGYVARFANTSPVFNGFTIEGTMHNEIIAALLKRDYAETIEYLRQDLLLSEDDI
ncbi:MAG: transcriptional regulator [Clostridiales bacterium]|jgi:DNA-binding GntR family transcriptional regulator|nr:transcriptional regulator [Clostridiales bacterium]